MEVLTKTQTAFRLSPELLAGMKRVARKRSLSLNAFVEKEMQKIIDREFGLPRLPREFFDSSQVLEKYAMSGGQPSLDSCKEAAMDKDVLYEALMEKYGEGIR
ncbi:MAG: hypothetical protein IK052_02860 [Bacteroidales bacterium]|nr:hypothetical protein [Bacteroidales bacterium]